MEKTKEKYPRVHKLCTRCQLCVFVTKVIQSLSFFLLFLLLLFLLGIPLSFMEINREYEDQKAASDATKKLIEDLDNFDNLTQLEDFSQLQKGCGFTSGIACDPKQLTGSKNGRVGCNWNIEGSMFFLMTVGTTIGYGNYTPQTLAGQVYVVCVLFLLLALAGTTYVAISTTTVQFLHLLVTGILCGSDEKAIINKKLRLHHESFNHENPDISLAEFLSMVDNLQLKPVDQDMLDSILKHANNQDQDKANISEITFSFEDYCEFCHENFDNRKLLLRVLSMTPGVLAEAFVILLLYIAGVFLLAFIAWSTSLGTDNPQSFWTACWFAVITFTTIGLGDYTPESFGMNNHILNTFMIMLGLGLFASVLSVCFKVIDHNIAPLPLVKKCDDFLLCRRYQKRSVSLEEEEDEKQM